MERLRFLYSIQRQRPSWNIGAHDFAPKYKMLLRILFITIARNGEKRHRQILKREMNYNTLDALLEDLRSRGDSLAEEVLRREFLDMPQEHIDVSISLLPTSSEPVRESDRAVFTKFIQEQCAA